MKKIDELDTANWSEACRWVGHAVKREAERLVQEGEHSPDSCLKAETLRAAWKRVQLLTDEDDEVNQ